ncbi:hypothetical protein [Streptosporangium sandarakinum]
MTSRDTLEPLVVYDAGDDTYQQRIGTPWHDQLLAWARSNGITPDDVTRLEVYLLDAPFARVYEYALDENGRRYLTNDGNDHARREPYNVLLTSLPPGMEIR